MSGAYCHARQRLGAHGACMIDGALDDTREHLETLAEARVRPHVLDDAIIERVEQVHTGQLQFVDIYAQQISRWRTEKPLGDQTRELDWMEAQNRHLRTMTADVLASAGELRKGIIRRVMSMSDVELGLQPLLGSWSPGRRQPGP